MTGYNIHDESHLSVLGDNPYKENHLKYDLLFFLTHNTHITEKPQVVHVGNAFVHSTQFASLSVFLVLNMDIDLSSKYTEMFLHMLQLSHKHSIIIHLTTSFYQKGLDWDTFVHVCSEK